MKAPTEKTTEQEIILHYTGKTDFISRSNPNVESVDTEPLISTETKKNLSPEDFEEFKENIRMIHCLFVKK